MNILILNWRDPKNPDAGGAEIVTLEHAKAWISAGHQVTWYSSSCPDAKMVEHTSGIRFIRFGHRYTIYFFAPFVYSLTGKYDLVIDEIHGIPFYTPLYVRKPKIAFIHEVAGEIWDHMFRFPINKIGKFLEKTIFTVYKQQVFMTVSESTKDELIKEGIPSKNIHVIRNGIHTAPLKTAPRKEKDPTFIFVSRLVRMKGIEDVIKAFSLIHKIEKGAKLWIIGDGDEEYVQALKDLVSTCGIDKEVLFKGYVSNEEKFSLMQRAHLLLHASVKEGWGLVVTEAASQGTPAIVYDVAGLRDSVIHEKTGIVLKNNTPEEMAEQVITLLRQKESYEKMQRYCLEEVKNLTWEKATEKSLQLIKSMTHEKSK